MPNLVRIIDHVKTDADGLFIQPTDPSPERESIEEAHRLNFAYNFFYADKVTGNVKSYDPDGDYTCDDCNKVDGTASCLILTIRINSQAGSCQHWTSIAASERELSQMGVVTAEEARYGVAENGKGFGCSRCPFAQPAHAPDSRGRDLYCAKGDFRVSNTACCALNGAAVVNTYEGNTPINSKE